MGSRELSVISAILLLLTASACLALALTAVQRHEAAALRPMLAALSSKYSTLELRRRFAERSSIVRRRPPPVSDEE